ncbi:hypothetical protein L1049_022968 [Liquidambar formosana]|uniref:Uncharacterized protein n=1 Tax=Liquidambar formosana TaxID=63359 RepID=A0AAP0RF65_LIQFO
MPSSDKESYHKYMNSIPCVTELLQAGVHFKKGDPSEILNIQFKDSVMIIPPKTILDNAESFIRNLIHAYEPCDHSCEDKITSYAVLLENLINSRRDIDFLRKKGLLLVT